MSILGRVQILLFCVEYSVKVDQAYFAVLLLEFAISLLIFRLPVLSVMDRGVLKSLVIIVGVSVSTLISVNFGFIVLMLCY